MLYRSLYQYNTIHKRFSRAFIWLPKAEYMHTRFLCNPLLSSTKLELILQSCPHSLTLQHGKQLHAQFVVNGITNNGQLGPKILGLYVFWDSFIDAKKLFYRLEFYYAMPWNWMIRGFIKMGFFDFALLFYFKMLGCGVLPDKYTFPAVIKACWGLNSVGVGKMVYDSMVDMGFDVDEFVGSSLIKLYAENGCIDDARQLFDRMGHKDIVLWNVMLNGFQKCGEPYSVVKMFQEMRHCETKPNSLTFACLLSVSAAEAMIAYGTQIHGLVIGCGLQFDLPVANTLVAMYSKCGNLIDARKLFDMMPEADLVTWNGMIAGYVQNGYMDEASDLFHEMISAGVRPDSTTFASFLPSVVESAGLRQGKEIHGYILRHDVILDVFLRCALIDIYFKCRHVAMACNIFNSSTTTDLVMSTAMISGYVLNRMNYDALETFRWLLKEKMSPNAVTLASVLPACADLAALNIGKELHCSIIRNGLDRKCHVESAIVDMYSKCGRLDLAHQIFGRMSDRDSVCWNSIITSCAQNGKPKEAIDLFRQMGMEGIVYNHVTISAALSACANLPALHYGKEVHSLVLKGSVDSDVFAQSALIDMYAKCGNLDAARRVFDTMENKNEVSWNSIIAAYGNHGHLDESLTLFNRMLENGFEPDCVTFLGIISACGHTGQIDDGVHYFRCMTEKYRISAGMEHYACMVDLFARAGRLHEAFETIKTMPFSPDAGIWGTLLGACRIHGNVVLAAIASRHLLDLDPTNSGYYILLSNIHANSGQWGGVRKIRSLMKDRGVQKVPGFSWIELSNTTHVFVASDGSHPESAHIYSLLKNLLLELRREGYVPQPYLQSHPQTRNL